MRRHDSSGDFIEPTQFAATGLEPPMTIAFGVHHARVAKQRCRPAMSHPVHRSDVYVFAFGKLGAKVWVVNRAGPTSSVAAMIPAEVGLADRVAAG